MYHDSFIELQYQKIGMHYISIDISIHLKKIIKIKIKLII